MKIKCEFSVQFDDISPEVNNVPKKSNIITVHLRFNTDVVQWLGNMFSVTESGTIFEKNMFTETIRCGLHKYFHLQLCELHRDEFVNICCGWNFSFYKLPARRLEYVC